MNRSNRLDTAGALTSGVLFVHSSPAALCSHVEWAVAGALGTIVDCTWAPQPARSGHYRCEFTWSAAVGTASAIVSALRNWDRLLFEVTEDATPLSEGARFSVTPELGVFHAVTGLHGDIMVPEDRLKAAIVKAAISGNPLELEVDKLLGTAWDEALEPYRYAGDGAPVRWLHHVV